MIILQKVLFIINVGNMRYSPITTTKYGQKVSKTQKCVINKHISLQYVLVFILHAVHIVHLLLLLVFNSFFKAIYFPKKLSATPDSMNNSYQPSAMFAFNSEKTVKSYLQHLLPKYKQLQQAIYNIC
jgi:hypothetical protein